MLDCASIDLRSFYCRGRDSCLLCAVVNFTFSPNAGRPRGTATEKDSTDCCLQYLALRRRANFSLLTRQLVFHCFCVLSFLVHLPPWFASHYDYEVLVAKTSSGRPLSLAEFTLSRSRCVCLVWCF